MTASAQVAATDWGAISGIIGEHVGRIDSGRVMESFEFYARTCRLEFKLPEPNGLAFEGREAVHDWFVKRAQVTDVVRHVVGSIRMRPIADDRIAADHALIFFRAHGGTAPMSIADIAETYVREDGQWRIAERIVTPVISR